ncbi:tRNA pseudouridine synthase A [Leucobacter sp. HY1910]
MTEEVELTRLRIDLAYEGTDFSGWAAQPGLRTVEGELERALSTLLRTGPALQAPPRLTVAGRTDAGVHARGQVAHIDVSCAQLQKWGGDSRLRVRKLGGVLKRGAADIVIHGVTEAPAGFDARFSALRRRYEYRLRGEGVRKDPLATRFTADVPRPLDLAAMQRASDELLGLNDFTTFCKAREGATAVRELLSFEWHEAADGAFAARIEADAFCHSMVRALVGAVVAVGSGRITEAELAALRRARERTSRFAVMPAHGLSLEEITYPGDAELALRAEQTRARRDPVRE